MSRPSPPTEVLTLRRSSAIRTSQPLRSSSSQVNWANRLLKTARAILSAGEIAPLSFIRAPSSTIVLLLETIQRMGKNADDLRNLAEAIVEIIVIVHDTVNAPGENSVSAFEILCQDFDKSLNDLLARLDKIGHDNHTWMKQYLQSSST